MALIAARDRTKRAMETVEKQTAVFPPFPQPLRPTL